MSKKAERQLSRRDFLRGVGALTGALTLESVTGSRVEASETEVAPDAVGVLIDLTRCTGCRTCEAACKAAHGFPPPDGGETSLSADTLTYVDVRENVEGADGPLHVKRQCMHCVHPACASACTVGALHKTPEGPVTYNAGKCIGCRYCQYACPFGVPAFQWEETLGLIAKCDFCINRLEEGQQPACVSDCPTGALKFGKRRALLREAAARMDTHPDRYLNHVYGEHEAGGTSMLYLSPARCEDLGFPELGSQPIPRRAEFVMKQTPMVALTVATAASGLCWLRTRREESGACVEAGKKERTKR